MTHSANGATTELNASAWDKNAIAFIRERGLESEFSDWCGGWPVPREARLDDARERQRHSSPPSSEGEGNRETNEKDRSISQSGYDAPDGAASAGSEGSGAVNDAARKLANRTLEYVGWFNGLFGPAEILDADAEIKDLALEVFRALGEPEPARVMRTKGKRP